jgi:ribosome-associated toxin RatA of RatAB toxin-antitoxin module
MHATSISKSLAALAVACSLVGVAAEAGAVDFTPGDKAKLSAGKTVRKPLPTSGEGGFYGGAGYALVKASPEAVWAAIEDWGSYPKVYPKTVSCVEVSRKGDKSLIHMEMGHELIRAEYYMTIERNREKYMLSFRLVTNKPHDIEDTRGYWRLFPQSDGQTLVAYVVATQIPMGIINLISSDLVAKIERNLLGIPNDLKAWVEGPHGAKYRTAAAAAAQ